MREMWDTHTHTHIRIDSEMSYFSIKLGNVIAMSPKGVFYMLPGPWSDLICRFKALFSKPYDSAHKSFI